MSETPAPRWFQLHRNAKIALLIAACLLVWLNVSCNLFFEWHHIDNITGQGADYYGFPLCVYSTTGFSYDPCSSWSYRIFAGVFNAVSTLGPLAFISEVVARNKVRLHFHLSTALLAMLVTAGILLLNLTAKIERDWHIYGWPFRVAATYSPTTLSGEQPSDYVDWGGIIIDGAIACGIVATVTMLCEYFIRRREGSMS